MVKEKKQVEEFCCNEETEKCKNCKYKEFFYSNQAEIAQTKTQETPPNLIENIPEIPKESPQPSIKHSLIPQFKYVFENYPNDDVLNNLIPNSKFVKIEENQSSYSIGAIYDEEEMKYICYAVLCNYNSPVPEELGEHYQWLPLDKEDPLSEGYYIVFQDAVDLKIVDI